MFVFKWYCSTLHTFKCDIMMNFILYIFSWPDVFNAAFAAHFFVTVHATTVFPQQLQFWKVSTDKSATSIQDIDFLFCRKWWKWKGSKIIGNPCCVYVNGWWHWLLSGVAWQACCLLSHMLRLLRVTAANYWQYESGAMPEGIWIIECCTIMVIC